MSSLPVLPPREICQFSFLNVEEDISSEPIFFKTEIVDEKIFLISLVCSLLFWTSTMIMSFCMNSWEICEKKSIFIWTVGFGVKHHSKTKFKKAYYWLSHFFCWFSRLSKKFQTSSANVTKWTVWIKCNTN